MLEMVNRSDVETYLATYFCGERDRVVADCEEPSTLTSLDLREMISISQERWDDRRRTAVSRRRHLPN